MAPRTVYANLPDGLANLNLWDQSLADMGSLGVIPCTASGTNAITLTPIASLFPPNINNPPNANQCFSFVATATSTGAVTVKIAGVTGFLNLYRMDAATQASSGDVQINVTYVVSFGSALNSNAGGFQIQSPVNNEINPIITGATISASTITTSTYNGNTWTAGTGILTIAALKTLTANNSLTLAGTDGTTMTFPTTSATVARTDAGQTFTGTQAFGAVTATTVNGNTLTAGTWTLTGVAAKTLTFNNSLTFAGTDGKTVTHNASTTFAGTDGKTMTISNSLTFAGTDGTTITFQGTDTYVGRATTDTLTNKTYDTAGTGNSFKINGTSITAVTGTGSVVLAASPAFTGSVLTNSTSGVGYSTGAGGTVTQLTSKATGVTLNTATGAITMNNSATGAGTIVSFVLTNSAIAATDVLILNHISGGTIGGYTLNAQCAAGSATITIRNNTAGTLSEALVLQFALIKAVNA